MKNVIIRTVCNHSVCIKCGLSVHVENGVINKVVPADFPDRADRNACAKGLVTPQLAYRPDRLKYPLKRIGKRGGDKWQRISWEEALDSISSKLQEIAQRYSSNSIAWCTIPFSSLIALGYSRLVSLTKGTWVDMRGFGDAAGPSADVATYGWFWGGAESPCSLVKDPKFSIVWGYNPAVTELRRMRRILENKKKGCQLVVIDPRFTDTANHGDEYIPIRPGTDGALALAMIHVILENQLQDERFIAESTVGPLLVRDDNGMFLRESDIVEDGDQQIYMAFDKNSNQERPCGTAEIDPALTGEYYIAGIKCQPAYQLLVNMVRDYTPEKVAGITDVPPDVIRRLAISYATYRPASIHRGWGMQRSFYGDLACRAINTLAMITGNIDLKLPSSPSSFVMKLHSLLTPGGPYKRIPVMNLYDAITKQEPLEVKAIWFAATNFVNQLPNQNKVISELFPGLELIVVCDYFMTATAKYADYVLPVASYFECAELHVSSYQNTNNTYLQLQQKVIEPLYECKSDFQICTELGRKMGFAEYFDKSEEEWIEEILTSDHPTMEGITMDRLKEGPVMAKLSDSPQKLNTPTGRIEFYVERLKLLGQELPIYLESVENIRTEKVKANPLFLLTSHTKHRIHSTFFNIPNLQRLDVEPILEINPTDAEARNISDGDVVRVFNDRGQVKLKAKLSQHIRLGVVNIEQGWWPEHYIEGHHNQLTHNRINQAQQLIFEPNAALYDVLVEVLKD